jgi:hypothetical protein
MTSFAPLHELPRRATLIRLAIRIRFGKLIVERRDVCRQPVQRQPSTLAAAVAHL